MNDAAQVFVVDDDEAVRDALALLLDTAGYSVATYSCAEEFLDACHADTLGCIILDVDMPGMGGLTLQQELISRGLMLPVIFLSGKGTIPITVRAIKAGAKDFLTKPVEASVLLAEVEEALVLSRSQQRRHESTQANASRLARLSEREWQVLVLILAGHTSKEIAQQLDISNRTVDIHRTNIMQKTGASSLMELARIAKFQALS